MASLVELETVDSFTDFVQAFSKFGNNMVELAHLTGDRQNVRYSLIIVHLCFCSLCVKSYKKNRKFNFKLWEIESIYMSHQSLLSVCKQTLV